MQKGTISVQTDNILPIIKQYLYSDQEIFLRELVANAVDATQKLLTLANRGEDVGDVEEVLIEVSVDQEAGTLTISDKGIGMTQDEVEKYITQIAFSGAKEFVEKYKDAKTVIGHFGLGFYSAFMVADKVEIHTKSYKNEAGAHWVSDGGTEYEIGESDKADRGTDIILHIDKELSEYTQEYRINELLTKYCRFLPIEIKFGTETQTIKKEDSEEEETFEVDKIVNEPNPIWAKKPADLTDEDYLNFYKILYPHSEDPLFWIHLNVDYPFNLTGVLYFPKLRNNLEIRKDRIHLYCNQVFVTEQTENIVPEFLTLLHGVIDSPDIPLNVSRSYLQSDPEVKKINRYITKKVASKLEEMFKNDRENFETKWEHIGVLIKYGMLSEEKFYEKAKNFVVFEDTNGKFATLEELKENIKDLQTDKDDKLVVLYTSNTNEQFSYIDAVINKGYQVIKLDTMLDPHFINKLEQTQEGKVNFKRVDADTIDKLIEKDIKIDSVLNEEQTTKVTDLFKSEVAESGGIVNVQALSPSEPPVLITRTEFMRRMKDMSAMGGDNMMGNMPDMYNLVVNANHPLVSKILERKTEKTQQKLTKQLFDLALLQQGMLQGEKLAQFVSRSVDLLK